MDLAQLANIGEFAGGLAVVITLGYLGLQTRQASRVTRAAMGWESIKEFNSMHETVLSNEALLETLMKVEGREELTPIEERRFRSYATRLLNTWNGIGLAHREGAVGDFLIEQMKDDVVGTCKRYSPLHPMLAGMLDSSSRLRDLDIFERFVNSELSDGRGAGR